MPIVSAQDLLINAITLDRPRCLRIALSTRRLMYPIDSCLLPYEHVVIDPDNMDLVYPLTGRQIDGAANAYRLASFNTFHWQRLDMQMLADRINRSRIRALGLLTDASASRDQDLYFSWMYGRIEIVCAWTVEKRDGEDVIVRRSSTIADGCDNPLRFMTRMEWRPQFPFSGNFFEPLE